MRPGATALCKTTYLGALADGSGGKKGSGAREKGAQREQGGHASGGCGGGWDEVGCTALTAVLWVQAVPHSPARPGVPSHRGRPATMTLTTRSRQVTAGIRWSGGRCGAWAWTLFAIGTGTGTCTHMRMRLQLQLQLSRGVETASPSPSPDRIGPWQLPDQLRAGQDPLAGGSFWVLPMAGPGCTAFAGGQAGRQAGTGDFIAANRVP